jgi:azurin
MFIQKRLLLFFFALLLMVRVNAHPVVDSVTTISINAIGGLQYDLVRFKVKPGAKVKIILTNKDDMSHNLVITMPGTRLEVVNAALRLGNDGLKMNYVPKLKEILWFIPILGPGETKSITFTAPKKTGVYPYVCTYPGHGFVMFGAMYVTDKAMPAIKDGPNIPPNRKSDKVVDNSTLQNHHEVLKAAHPYKEIPPYMYRIFIPDASPAAIAVNLPHKLSYCWDAGTCRLRYAWQGNFLDNTDIWKGHLDAYGNILGAVFFRDKTVFPLQVDKPGNIPAVEFIGYHLIKRYPEFHYTINGIEVYELIKPKEDGTGLIRAFRIPKTNRLIWFVFDSEDGVNYTSSVGKWIDGKLKLLPAEARQFTIIMTKKNL